MICANTNSYNVYIAKTFGVYTSILMGLIDTAYMTRVRNNCLNADGSFALNRVDIMEMTGMNDEEQKRAESQLNSLGVLVTKPFKGNPSKTYYFYDPSKFCDSMCKANGSVASVTDELLSQDKNAFVKVKRVPKRVKDLNSIKRSIEVQNEAVRACLCEWVDCIFANPKKYMTIQSFKICVEELFEYTSDPDVMCEIIRIATKNCWADVKWAIKQYSSSKGNAGNSWVDYGSIVSDGTDIVDEEF